MSLRRGAVLVVTTVVSATAAHAQPLGTFRWQVQPYCNVLTVRVTQNVGIYTLDGTDDQCGAGTLGSVVGIAFPNPNGTIGLGVTIVGTPGGAPAHLDAIVTLPSASGTWRDGAGNTGTFVLTPGTGTGGTPRPAGGIGRDAIDASQVQQRVLGSCPPGQAMQSVNQDGTVNCGVTGGGGALTGVAAGAGLSGGGTSGVVPLAVSFGGTGTAAAVARADHHHSVGSSNTATGFGALASATSSALSNVAVGLGALTSNTTGDFNTAFGYRSLAASTANSNTAVGALALEANTSGIDNVAMGRASLIANTSGVGNVAVGTSSLLNGTTASYNTAIGWATLVGATGSSNIALGAFAGSELGAGDGNIYIGASGNASDDWTTRIGYALSDATYVSGLYGKSVSSSTDQAVFVDLSGKLGTVVSSGRFKEDVQPIADELTPLQRLRAVSYRYKPELGRGSTRQYGLIAEEVAEVMPELAIVDDDGSAQSVRYHLLAPLHLAEVQRLERERAALEAMLQRERAAFDARLSALERRLPAGGSPR